jgi:hypothetical protein
MSAISLLKWLVSVNRKKEKVKKRQLDRNVRERFRWLTRIFLGLGLELGGSVGIDR